MPIEAPKVDRKRKLFVSLKKTMIMARSVFGDSIVSSENNLSPFLPFLPSVDKLSLRTITHFGNNQREIMRKMAFRVKIANVEATYLPRNKKIEQLIKDPKGAERFRKRRGRRPRRVCPDCGTIYILMLGHSNCRNKKSEKNTSFRKAA
ncbi:hypothetical protein HYU93_05285 [Candidatus Daviesbacteria bacterium]|nr:hypothetical protein [Candidatus Daviesbacteria bacterium]